jgi:lipid-binding SYLF domain-containing protein
MMKGGARYSMKARSFFLKLAAVTLICSVPGIANVLHAGYNEESKVESAREVISEIMSVPETSIPTSLLKNAYGVAVIPGVIKAGVIVGGRAGRGVLVVRTADESWSNPTFVTIASASLGFQIGAQSTDIILVFKSRKSIDGIVRGKFTLGADASVAAGPVGRQVEAGTDIQFKAEILSYSRSRGLFAGVSLEGSALQIDDEYNAGFYGDDAITADKILTGKTKSIPQVAEKFIQELEKHTKTVH